MRVDDPLKRQDRRAEMWSSSDTLIWDRDGIDWPNRSASRFVTSAGLTWHVQRMGSGPCLLLLHGTGASTHSWRGMLPLLARDFDVVALDLPGHAFTSHPPAGMLTLPGMARAVAALLNTLDVAPAVVVGHSAGAAIAARMSIDGAQRGQLLVSLNGALLPFPGVGRYLFPGLAKLFYTNPIVPRLMAWRARDRRAVDQLLEGTGSQIDEQGLSLYARLFRAPSHVAATLSMMANWDLVPLESDLPRLQPLIYLVVGGRDRAVKAEDGLRVASLAPKTRAYLDREGGHLAHEERPTETVSLIIEQAAALGILAAGAASRGARSP